MLLSRYLAKELFSKTLLILFSLYIVLLVSQVIRVSLLISSFGFSLSNVLRPLFYISVSYLGVLTPLAFFMGVMMTVLKLSETEELTAILSFGRGLFDLSRPFFLVGLFFFSFSFLSTNYLEAWGKRNLLAFAQEKALNKIYSSLSQKMQKKSFIEIFEAYHLYAEELSSDKKKYKKVIFVPKHHGYPRNSFVVVAEEGETLGLKEEKNLVLKFKKGTLYKLSSSVKGGASAMDFENFEIDFFSSLEAQFGLDSQSIKHIKSKTSWEIYETLREDKTLSVWKRKKFSYLLYHRVFSPFLVFAFCCWGIFLGIYNPRQKKGFQFLYFFLIFFSVSAGSSLLEKFYMKSNLEVSFLVPGAYLFFLSLSFLFLYWKNKRPFWEPFRFSFKRGKRS